MKFVISILISLSALSASAREGLVLIYSGAGSCTDGCAEAAAEIPARMGFRIQYVKPEEIKPELLKTAKVWMQPGGDAIVAAKAMGPEGLSAIREFVRAGGGYVGFCAGAFLSDKTVDNSDVTPGLGILPIGTFDYPLDSHNGDGAMTWINWGGRPRHLFFNGGGSFYLNKSIGQISPEVKVLATFVADGLPATIETTFGKGRVVVSGAHPEATYAWKSEGGLVDEDGPDFDLAIDMVRKALPK